MNEINKAIFNIYLIDAFPKEIYKNNENVFSYIKKGEVFGVIENGIFELVPFFDLKQKHNVLNTKDTINRINNLTEKRVSLWN